ncbi:DUF4942 domain-containing protein, partial [Geobacter argillaceus]|uniref:DUF4942 domain-containing protein n=1 Tax=Geobacter argillaceus TaxID=345631 RepID=UPI00119FBF3F
LQMVTAGKFQIAEFAVTESGTNQKLSWPTVRCHTDSSDGTGKTDYFKFRCCLNGNLHLVFLKPGLVAKLNAIAGDTHTDPQGGSTGTPPGTM